MLISRLSLKRVYRPLAVVGIAGLFAVACGDDGGDPDPIPADGGSTSATASAAVSGTASAKPSGSTSASAKPSGSTSASGLPTTSPADGGGTDGGPITGDASDDGGSSTPSDAGADDDASSTPNTDAAASSSGPFQFPDAGACGAEGEQCCTAMGGGGMGGGGAGTCDDGLVCDTGGPGPADNLCATPAPVPDTGTADTGAGEVDAAVEADAGDAGACGGSGQVCCAFTGPGTRCEEGMCTDGFCP
jgi:hypothetical protein